MSQKRHTPADEPFFVIRTLASTFRSGHEFRRHRHDWHQLVYAATGVLTVWTETGTWVAPPQWAIWVPGGREHGISFSGECALKTLYLRPRRSLRLPAGCTAVTVTPLMRELIAKAMALGMVDRRIGAHRAVAQLILEEFVQCEAPPFDVPQPTGAATRQVAAAICDAPESAGSTAQLARRVGLSARTLERRFLEETGLSFGRWRRQVRLLAALKSLAAGHSVKRASAAAGYAEPSAFVAAFKQLFGRTPGQYFRQ